MTENNIPTSEILNRAADLIQERGWTTGHDFPTDSKWDPWGVEGGPLCLEGGIKAAVGARFICDTHKCDAYRAVESYLDRADKPGWLWMWNDDRQRTATEVIEVLRAAAAIEQARESDVAPLATTQREVSA